MEAEHEEEGDSAGPGVVAEVLPEVVEVEGAAVGAAGG